MSGSASRYRPQLEALEDRQLLASKISFDLSNTTMFIQGDSKANTVSLFDDGTGGFGNVTGEVDHKSFDFLTSTRRIRNIVLDMGKGNDSVFYVLQPTTVNARMAVSAHLGTGNDTFGLAADNVVFSGAVYDFSVFGDTGNDVITASALNSNLFGGSRLNFSVQGGAGADAIRAVQSGFMEFQTTLNVQFSGGLGNDTMSIDSTLANFSRGSANLRVNGDEGSDHLDLVARQQGTLLLSDLVGIIDGGSGPNDKRRVLHPNDIEDITATGNVFLQNFDPRSHISWIYS